MSAWHHELGVFDLETTGINVETSRIVSAHVGVLDASGQLVQRRDWIVNPGIPIPAMASAVHGITTERAQKEGALASVSVGEILAEITALFARSVPVVAYNAPYDFTILNREAKRYSHPPLLAPAPIIDPLVIDRAVDRYRRGKRTLSVTAEYYGVLLDEAHDAAADAIAAGRVAQAIAQKHADSLPTTARELHDLQVGWSKEQADSFQAWMRANKNPSFVTSGMWPER